MSLVRIACLVRKAAGRVDLECASRPCEPMILRRDTDATEEVRVGDHNRPVTVNRGSLPVASLLRGRPANRKFGARRMRRTTIARRGERSTRRTNEQPRAKGDLRGTPTAAPWGIRREIRKVIVL